MQHYLQALCDLNDDKGFALVGASDPGVQAEVGHTLRRCANGFTV